MSRTTMYAAPENGEFHAFAEFSNAWGSAMFVWRALCKKYLSDEMAVFQGTGERCWALAKDPRLTPCERFTLISTFDKALVDREHFVELAGHFRDFVKLHPAGDRVCHLLGMALELEVAATAPPESMDGKLMKALPAAIGWHQTSASENPWTVRVGEDEWRPYSLATDEGHFWIFDPVEEETANEP